MKYEGNAPAGVVSPSPGVGDWRLDEKSHRSRARLNRSVVPRNPERGLEASHPTPIAPSERTNALRPGRSGLLTATPANHREQRARVNGDHPDVRDDKDRQPHQRQEVDRARTVVAAEACDQELELYRLP